MLALSDVLENAGYSTELRAMNRARNPMGDTVVSVRLKEAGEPLRADTVATCAAHSAFFRMYALAAVCRAPFLIGMGHGSQQGLGNIVEKLIAEGATDKVDIFIKPCRNWAEVVAELTRIIELVNAGMVAA